MTLPQSHSDVSMQAIFLMLGAERARNKPHGSKAPMHSEGHLGQAQMCADFAEQMSHFLNDPNLPDDFPGVFNYEVTEDMGFWLMYHQHATRNEFRVELDRVFLEFMSQ